MARFGDNAADRASSALGADTSQQMFLTPRTHEAQRRPRPSRGGDSQNFKSPQDLGFQIDRFVMAITALEALIRHAV
jgi:hypothetical protein